MWDIIQQPFAWLLLSLYELVLNYGLAVILFALIVKLILMPFQMKAKRSMMRMSRFTPRLKELEKKHQGNKEKYNEAVAKLYKEEKVSPMSGCLWNLIPFPILLALYSVIRKPLTAMMRLSVEQVQTVTDVLEKNGVDLTRQTGAYGEIELAQKGFDIFDKIIDKVPEFLKLDYSFFGLNLGEIPDWKFFTHTDWSDTGVWLPALGLFLIPVISAVLSFLQTKVGQKATPQGDSENPAAATTKSMTYMMPLVSLYIGFIMPAALGVYWIASSLFALIQDLWLNRRYTKILDAEDAERLERERIKAEEIERKRLETEKRKAENATSRNPNTSKKKIQALEKSVEEKKAAEWEGKTKGAFPNAPKDRPFARGRAYVPDRYDMQPAETSAEEQANEEEPLLIDELPDESRESVAPQVSSEVDNADAEEDEYEDYEDEND